MRQLRRPRRARRRRALASPARSPPAGSNPDKVDERTFARHLYVPELSDADLVWRTSGEQRLSNFMLWQAAYSELVFTDVLWPDVDRRHLWAAIEAYAAATAATAGPDRTGQVRVSPSWTGRTCKSFPVRGRLTDELRRLWLEPRDPRLPSSSSRLLFLLDMALRVAGGVELRHRAAHRPRAGRRCSGS